MNRILTFLILAVLSLGVSEFARDTHRITQDPGAMAAASGFGAVMYYCMFKAGFAIADYCRATRDAKRKMKQKAKDPHAPR